MAKRRPDLAALLLLAVVTTVFFADVLFGTNRFFIRDLTRYYFPTKRIIREIILSGEFPYWNPYYSAGQPMAANPEYEIFYPPQLLVLIPNYDLGYRLHIVFHYYAVTFGLYLLLRSIGLRIPSALFGTISIGLGGLYMSFGNLLPILFAAAWIPWILLFARRFLLRPNLRDFAGTALFLGLQDLVGEPTTMLQTWTLVGMYALYRGWYDGVTRIRGMLRNAGLALLLVVAGMTIGAAQIVPAFDHVADSARSRPFTFDLVTAWSMPYARPLELIFPNVFGHVYKHGTWFWGGGMYAGMGSPFLFSIYLGLLPAILLMAAPFARQRGSRLVLLIFLISMLIALGKNTPVYRWLYDAHLATSVRYPEKFAFLGLLSCAIFASMLFDRLLEGDARLLRIVAIVTTVVLVVTAGLAIFSATDLYAATFKKLWGQEKSPNAAFLVTMSRGDWLVAAGRATVAALLIALVLVARRRRSGALHSAWPGLVVAFLIVDVAPIQFDVLPRVSKRFFTPPPVAATLDRDKAEYRIFHEADWYGTTDVARRFLGTADAIYWVVRNGLYPMTPASWGFRTVLERDYDKTHLHPTIDLTESMWEVKRDGQKQWREIFTAMSNARFHSEYRDFERERRRIRGNFKIAQPVNFVRDQDNGRYYFADQLVTIRDRADFTRKLTKGDYSRRVAFVTTPAFKPAAGHVILHGETANTVRVEVEATGQAFLVLSVTPHKYWRATLDGKPVALQRVNLGYQGVIVPSGRHVLQMRYRNTLIPIALTVSIVTAAALLALLILSSRRARRAAAVVPSAKIGVVLS